MAKRFFYLCAGVLCLAFAYHLGASNASAQAESRGRIRHAVAYGDVLWVITDTDDIYSINRTKAPSLQAGDGWVRYKLGILN